MKNYIYIFIAILFVLTSCFAVEDLVQDSVHNIQDEPSLAEQTRYENIAPTSKHSDEQKFETCFEEVKKSSIINDSSRLDNEAECAPKNVILFIGDGMGYAHIEATNSYKSAGEEKLFFEHFENHASVTTYSASHAVTCSAAAGTAMATGHKVNEWVVSMQIPGDGSELETITDFFKDKDKATGIVTTTFLTDATPAAFLGHAPDRTHYETLAWHYFNTSLPDVLLGGGGAGIVVDDDVLSKYQVVFNSEQLQNAQKTEKGLLGHFGNGNMPYEIMYNPSYPHLYEMTTVAIDHLSAKEEGFFLMVEGGRIDHAGHSNDIIAMIHEMLAFELAICSVWKTGIDLDETLIIVTSDHETGGLSLFSNEGKNKYPIVSWSTGSHTDDDIPLYATGACSHRFKGKLDNTDIPKIIKGMFNE